MGLFDFLFGKKPQCEGCGEKVEDELKGFEDKQLCEPCYDKAVEARRQYEAELEARRVAEEEARKKLEDNVSWGRDPRRG